MPVVQWGVGGVSEVVKELPRLKEIGFTHCLGLDVDEHQVWQQKQPQEAWPEEKRRAVAAMLDEALANDFQVLISLSPGSTFGQSDQGILTGGSRGQSAAAGGDQRIVRAGSRNSARTLATRPASSMGGFQPSMGR